jgi:hypothetical protein
MEVDLSSIMASAPEPAAQSDYSRFSMPDMAIPDEVNNNVEKTRAPDEKSDSNANDATTDKDQRELATQIRQCFEEFPEKLSMLKNTKLEGKSIEELQKIWSEIEYIMGAK